MDLGLWIDVGMLIVLAAIVARVEAFTVRKVRKEGQQIHTEASAAVTADIHDQYERLAQQVKNHIQGPTHRR